MAGVVVAVAVVTVVVVVVGVTVIVVVTVDEDLVVVATVDDKRGCLPEGTLGTTTNTNTNITASQLSRRLLHILYS